MMFHEWKQRSKAYRKAMAAAGDDSEAKKIESLCRAAFAAGVDWGLETYEAKVGARKTATEVEERGHQVARMLLHGRTAA